MGSDPEWMELDEAEEGLALAIKKDSKGTEQGSLKGVDQRPLGTPGSTPLQDPSIAVNCLML